MIKSTKVTDSDRVYTAREFADILNVSLMTLYRWEQSGKLVPYRNMSNKRYYTKKHIDIYLGRDSH